MSIGTKGMIVAAKTLARTALDILSDPSIVTEARAEFGERRGEDFRYMPLIGDGIHRWITGRVADREESKNGCPSGE